MLVTTYQLKYGPVEIWDDTVSGVSLEMARKRHEETNGIANRILCSADERRRRQAEEEHPDK